MTLTSSSKIRWRRPAAARTRNPLHPPKKPENLRVAHFGAIDVPCLFVSGDRDEFGSPDEFDEHVKYFSGNGSDAFSVFSILHSDDNHLWQDLPLFGTIMRAFTSTGAIFGDDSTVLRWHQDPNTFRRAPADEGGARVFSSQLAISGGVNVAGQVLGFSPFPRRNFCNGSYSGVPVPGVPLTGVAALAFRLLLGSSWALGSC